MNFSNIKDWTIPEGEVVRVTDSLGRVIWEKQGGHDYSQDYFFVEDASGAANTLSIKKNVGNSAPTIRVYKSTDQINWTYVGQTSTTALTLTIPANSKVYLKATTNSWAVFGANNNNIIYCTGYFNVGGNIMSLLYGDNFRNATLVDGTNDYAFSCLFENQYVIDASNLVFPNTVANRCYEEMFASTYLVNPPAVLPATTLANYCYYYMFYNCTSLTSAPVLPATSLAQSCYNNMFRYCTSLPTAPALPATTLVDGCYLSMFSGCKSLTTTPALPATTLAQSCYNSMFQNCTSLTTAPALPATTLATTCYRQMFYGCTTLNQVTTYADDISATNCLNSWLQGVAAQGDFYNLGSATYTADSASGIPTGWTEHNTI